MTGKKRRLEAVQMKAAYIKSIVEAEPRGPSYLIIGPVGSETTITLGGSAPIEFLTPILSKFDVDMTEMRVRKGNEYVQIPREQDFAPQVQESSKTHYVIDIMTLWSAILPARINREELGDYMEEIVSLIAAGESRWIIYLRVATAIFWTGLNAVSYFLKQIRKKSST
jgi:hypothetical protein